MSKPEVDPREYCKIRYSAPPESCKCGNCQLVPPDQLIAWSDLIESQDDALEAVGRDRDKWKQAYEDAKALALIAMQT